MPLSKWWSMENCQPQKMIHLNEDMSYTVYTDLNVVSFLFQQKDRIWQPPFHKAVKILCEPVEKLSHRKILFRHNISLFKHIQKSPDCCAIFHMKTCCYKELSSNCPFFLQKYNWILESWWQESVQEWSIKVQNERPIKYFWFSVHISKNRIH